MQRVDLGTRVALRCFWYPGVFQPREKGARLELASRLFVRSHVGSGGSFRPCSSKHPPRHPPWPRPRVARLPCVPGVAARPCSSLPTSGQWGEKGKGDEAHGETRQARTKPRNEEARTGTADESPEGAPRRARERGPTRARGENGSADVRKERRVTKERESERQRRRFFRIAGAGSRLPSSGTPIWMWVHPLNHDIGQSYRNRSSGRAAPPNCRP
jgi:hypothetical protein